MNTAIVYVLTRTVPAVICVANAADTKPYSSFIRFAAIDIHNLRGNEGTITFWLVIHEIALGQLFH